MPTIPHHILLINCPDRKGIIAQVTALLFKNNLNIVVMKEFVDAATNSFFARAEITGKLSIDDITDQLRSIFDEKAVISISPVEKKKIVVLVTKEHHCLSDLIVRFHFDELHATLQAVIGNYETLQPFTQKFGIPFHFVDHEQTTKQKFEADICSIIDKYQPDYIVLAKFMRILSPEFVARFENKIINIHHSFLPAFVGANPYKQAYERGVKLIGATAHIVNNQLDEGPIITQKIIPVNHEYNVKQMVEAGHEIEKSVLAEALKLILEDRVFVANNKTIIFN
ncbi:MAG: formyltetrahydrofolate deformylase [Bacteroidota bacterium]